MKIKYNRFAVFPVMCHDCHIEEHSKKPAETRDRIVKLMAGGGGYLK